MMISVKYAIFLSFAETAKLNQIDYRKYIEYIEYILAEVPEFCGNPTDEQ